MSREIKFRAWDKADCTMTPDPFAWLDVRDELLNYREGQFERNHPDKRYEILQYTGLKDKGGVEIYEGDIVRQLIKSEYLDESDWLTIIGVVNILDGCWCINEGCYPLFCFSNEVIGNIYENKNLIDNNRVKS